MSVIEDTAKYEEWLATQTYLVRSGIKKKHKRMADDPFRFFRATCYRFARKLDDWLEDWQPDFQPGPIVPSVGDAHIENWGTWRDGEGRLVWGVNDFDEAAALPWTYDLLRLMTSARLAPGLPGSDKDWANALLQGYRRGLDAPCAFFPNDRNGWFLDLINEKLSFDKFEKDLAEADPADPPIAVRSLLQEKLPPGTQEIEFLTWYKGGGSLGRPRYVATGTWQGGKVVREAKALTLSAWAWAGVASGDTDLFMAMANGRYRSPDPFLGMSSNFIVRRIAADSHKINLGEGGAKKYNSDLFELMGAELAAIHLSGNTDAAALIADFNRRSRPSWLVDASAKLENEIQEDYRDWLTANPV